MPMDSTSANIERLFSEKPNAAITASVPISDIGIASSGMMAVRQRCRNSTTTMTARIIASSSVWRTASTAARVNDTGLKMISYATPGGNSRFSSSIVARMLSQVSSALVLGAWFTDSDTAGSSLL
jgi:hypothetical protein